MQYTPAPLKFEKVDDETWEATCPILKQFWTGYITEEGQIEEADDEHKIYDTPELFFAACEEERLALIESVLTIAASYKEVVCI